ncbi:orf322 (mitochondrion) [Pleurotus ostreatus]|uniref:Orf322 n=1 Tax=Pleurotus ostreatus TaxID=5322 RepID=A7KCT1_PLEOS|nr:orf322 [Pleurotus ostreatus]ABM67612.1 orf322 [Pleurotus ostreatus]WJJ45473.1 hypothetical protein [Pleurotus ostreatus]
MTNNLKIIPNFPKNFYSLEAFKPLGKFLDKNLNELINTGLDIISPLYDLYLNYPTELTSLASFIPAIFIYKSIVNLYSNIAFKHTPTNFSPIDLHPFTQMKSKEVKLFMNLGTPFLLWIVGILYAIRNILFQYKITLTIDNSIVSDNFTSNTNNEDNLNSGFGIIAFLKNKKPFWIKEIIVIGISLYFLNYLYKNLESNENNILSSYFLNYIIYVKIFFIFGLISSLFMILYYICTIYLFIMFSKKKISKPIYLPEFILNWIDEIHKMSFIKNKGFFIEFYFRLIMVYLFIFVLTFYTLICLFNIQ